MPSFTFLSTASDVGIRNCPPFFQSCDCNIIIGDFTWNTVEAVQMNDHLGDGALFGANNGERNVIHCLRRNVDVPNLVFMSGNSWPCMVVLLYYLKTVGIHWIFIGLLVNEGRADIENYASCIVALVCSRHNHPEFVRKLGIECVYIKFLLFITLSCSFIIDDFKNGPIDITDVEKNVSFHYINLLYWFLLQTSMQGHMIQILQIHLFLWFGPRPIFNLTIFN